MLKLLRPFRLCVIDEFAADLDIFSRKRFFDYLSDECEARGAHCVGRAQRWPRAAGGRRPTLAAVRRSRRRALRTA